MGTRSKGGRGLWSYDEHSIDIALHCLIAVERDVDTKVRHSVHISAESRYRDQTPKSRCILQTLATFVLAH